MSKNKINIYIKKIKYIYKNIFLHICKGNPIEYVCSFVNYPVQICAYFSNIFPASSLFPVFFFF